MDTLRVCVATERDYYGTIDVEAVANFASAAVLATLTPADWQICQDAKVSAGTMAIDAVAAGATQLIVRIVVHATDVEVSVTSDVGADRIRLAPRRAFTSGIVCPAA